MTVWIIFQNTDFCTTWWEERLYNCIVGVIYCFCFFNIQEGQTRYRMSVYYVLVISQNISFLSAFFIAERSTKNLKYFMMLFVPPGIIIGKYFFPPSQINWFIFIIILANLSKSVKKKHKLQKIFENHSEVSLNKLHQKKKRKFYIRLED